MSAQIADTPTPIRAISELTIRAERVLDRSAEAYTLRITVTALRKIGDVLAPIGQSFTSNLSVPVATFRDEAQAHQWADHTFGSFRARVTAALVNETVSVAADEANWALADLGIESVEFRDVLDRHLKETDAHLRERFNLPKTGRPAQWTRLELLEALRLSASKLPQNERTIPRVFERLKEAFPDHAPANAAALRRMLSRFKIRRLDFIR
jgi:hypothetical protein